MFHHQQVPYVFYNWFSSIHSPLIMCAMNSSCVQLHLPSVWTKWEEEKMKEKWNRRLNGVSGFSIMNTNSWLLEQNSLLFSRGIITLSRGIITEHSTVIEHLRYYWATIVDGGASLGISCEKIREFVIEREEVVYNHTGCEERVVAFRLKIELMELREIVNYWSLRENHLGFRVICDIFFLVQLWKWIILCINYS